MRLQDVLPAPVPMVSAREAAAYLSQRLPVNVAQALQLADAGVLGVPHTGELGSAYLRDRLDWLLSRPVWTVQELPSVGSMRAFPMVLVMRVKPLEGVDEDPPRPFLGAHVATEASPDPAVRAAADDAVRMFWRVSPSRQNKLRLAWSRGPVPALLTVGGWVVGGRDLTGFDPSRGHNGKIAFTLAPASAWFAPFRDTWLPSGRGGPLLWRDVREAPG